MGDNESLVSKLKEASDDLEAKKNRLDSLAHDKSEALKLLELNQHVHDTDFESFKLREEALRRDAEEAEKEIKCLLEKEPEATRTLEEAKAQNLSLSGKVESLKTEHVEILHKLHDRIAMLEDETMFMTIEKAQYEEQLQFMEADLERSMRLHEHLGAAVEDKLVIYDETTKLQEEMAQASRQLEENREASKKTISTLRLNIDEMTGCVKNLENDKVRATAESHALTERVRELKSQRDALQLTLDTKVTELQMDLAVTTDKNETLVKKLKETSADLHSKENQLERLVNEKNEALQQLDMTQEKNTVDVGLFKLQEEAMQTEIKKGLEATETLRKKVNVAEAMFEEEHRSNTLLNIKIAELQEKLDTAISDNESSTKRMKDVSDDLEIKQTQLEGLECDKRQALKQLEMSQEKSNAELNSHRTREERLKLDIKNRDAAIESLKGNLDAAEEELAKIGVEHADSISALRAKIASLQNDLSAAKDDNASTLKRADDASEDLKVKQRQLEDLEREKSESLKQLEMMKRQSSKDIVSFQLQEEALKVEIKKKEVAVESLQDKVGAAEEKLPTMSETHVTATNMANYKVTGLMNDPSALKGNNELLLEQANNTLDTLKVEGPKKMNAEHARTISALNAKIVELQNALVATKAGNESMAKRVKDDSDELNIKQAQLEGLEHQKRESLKQLETVRKQSNADRASFELQNGTLEAEMKKGAELVDYLRDENNKLKEELGLMKKGIESERKTNAEKENTIPSQWNQSPIKSVGKPLQDSTFDDSIDSALFFPNLDPDDSAILNADENGNTPSKTPFKGKRALFSPSRENSRPKPQTPLRKMARSCTRALSSEGMARTPLGKSTVENTPSTQIKVRTNWSNTPMC